MNWTPATETATEPENIGLIETPLVLMSWGMSILRLSASSVFWAIGKAGTSDPVTAMHVSVNS